MQLALTVAIMVSLLAALVWMVLFYQYDRGRPEPLRRVALSCLFGAIAVVPAIAWEGWAAGWIHDGTRVGQFVTAFLVVGLGEEGLKFAAAYVAAYRPGHKIALPVDAMIYAIAAGLGFAAVENVLYARAFGLEVLALRAVVGFVVHAGFAGVFGYWVGVALSRGTRIGWYGVKGVALAAALHGLYDFAILSGILSPAGILWAVGGLYFLLSSRLVAAQEAVT